MSQGLKLLAAISERGSTVTFRLLEDFYFVDQEELSTFHFMRDHLRRYNEIPAIETIEDFLHKRLPDSPESVDYYLDKVNERHVYNGVRGIFGDLRDSLREVDVPSILDNVKAIQRICTPFSGQSQELMTLAELQPQIRRALELKRSTYGLIGCATGWDYLDTETGGYQNGDLITFVARMGMGKSWLLIHKAMSAFNSGKAVLMVSMEMPLNQMANRISAYQSGVNPYYIKTGRIDNFAMQRLQDTYSTLSNARNFHLYAGNFKKTTDDLDNLIQELSPDIVYIDGMYLMTPVSGNSRAGRYEKAAYLSDDIKRICLMRDRPIVTTTQFGREAKGKGKDGTLENIGYTDTIGTHSSIVCAIKSHVTLKVGVRSSDDLYEGGPERNSHVRQIAREPYRVIEILKGREGEYGEFGTNFSFAPTNFREIPIHIAKGAEDLLESPNLDYMG